MRWRGFREGLRTARKRAGLTQERLAERLSDHLGTEVSQQNIQQWCSGQYRPADRLTLVGLCYVLYRAGGFTEISEVNHLLQAADQGALHADEVSDWFLDLSLEGRDAPPGLPAGAAGHNEPTAANVQIVTTPVARLPLAVGSLRQASSVGVILAAAAFAGGGCMVAAQHQGWIGATLWVACLWCSTLLLAWPRRMEAQGATSASTWLRLSGTAGGVLLVASLLVWTAAMSNVFFGAKPPAWLIFGLSGQGCALSYVAGMLRQHQANAERHRRTAIEIAVAMLIAQAQLGFLLVALPSEVANYVLIVGSVLLLLLALARARHGRAPVQG